MDFTSEFETQFQSALPLDETSSSLIKKLQDTRHALQESISETDQLVAIIEQLYSETRVENVVTSELTAQIQSPLFRNVPLPRNADGLSVSERAGYVLYYMKFLGFASRKSLEEYHNVKEHLDQMGTSVTKNTMDLLIKRTGSLKVPELDGKKEMKSSTQVKPTITSPQIAKSPISPPVTPPQIIKQKQNTKK